MCHSWITVPMIRARTEIFHAPFADHGSDGMGEHGDFPFLISNFSLLDSSVEVQLARSRA
jgi:hypothetical protein